MIEALNKALMQIGDPAFLGVVLRSVALSAIVFVLLALGVFWAALHLSADIPHWLASLLGGLTGTLAALLLFVPLAAAIASSFTTPIAAAVERRWYPGLLPARPASLGAQLWDGAALALRVALLQALALLLALLLPGIGLVLGWLVSSWAVGRGLFLPVAMRRMNRRDAMAAYRARRGAVIAQGAAVTLAATIPGINLIAPIIGIAALTHVLHHRPGLSPPPRL